VRARLYFDGASRGNPGEAGTGFLILDSRGKELERGGRYLGQATNNVAEYSALIDGLSRALELGVDDIEIFSDSELVVLQLKGEYRVKSPKLKPLHEKATSLLSRFSSFKIIHVGRENNREADRLANEAIDFRKT